MKFYGKFNSAKNSFKDWLSLINSPDKTQPGKHKEIDSKENKPQPNLDFGQKPKEFVQTNKKVDLKKEAVTLADEHAPLMERTMPLSKSFNSFFSLAELENVVKIGEASYSDVYSINKKAIKIIPFGNENQATWNEAFNEIRVLEAVKNLDNFVSMQRWAVCSGPYSKQLLEAWEEFKPTDNERPDKHKNQLYAVLELENGGIDLEKANFRKEDCRALLKKVAVAIVKAEEILEFEHRDLHQGNILLDENLNPTIIDFTLSRLKYKGAVYFINLQDLFDGKGQQFEVYRRMREETQENWNQFFPATNVFWFHYLVGWLAEKFRCRELRALKKRIASCTRLSQVISDDYILDLEEGVAALSLTE